MCMPHKASLVADRYNTETSHINTETLHRICLTLLVASISSRKGSINMHDLIYEVIMVYLIFYKPVMKQVDILISKNQALQIFYLV